MKKITDIMHPYFEKIKARPMNESCPIVPRTETWSVFQSPERLSKTFEFKNRERMKIFLSDLLNFEDEYGHHGKITVDHLTVQVDVYTLDLNRITNLDREYAKIVDMVNRDSEDFNFDR